MVYIHIPRCLSKPHCNFNRPPTFIVRNALDSFAKTINRPFFQNISKIKIYDDFQYCKKQKY